MPIDIECDDCGNRYRVADEKAGGKVRCKECGAKIEVPGGDRDLFEDDVPRRSSSRKKKKGSSGPDAGVLVGVGGIAVVCLIGVVLFVAFGRGGNRAAAPQIAQNNPIANMSNPLPVVNPLPQPPDNTPPALPANPFPSSPAANTAAQLPPPADPASTLPDSNRPAPFPARNGVPVPGSRPNPHVAGTQPRPTGAAKRFSGFTGGDAGKGSNAPASIDAPPPENWKVKVDPSTVEAKIDPAKPINIKFPKDGGHTDIIYPVTPSVYVALGSNSFNRPVREIWNLATRGKTGTITPSVMRGRTKEALSPDGQHVAATIDKFFDKKNGVRVWAAKGNKGLGELQTDAEVKAVLFPSPQRLMAICAGGAAYVWKIPSGDLEHELALEKAEEASSVAVSPGGNYLAVVVGPSNFKVFDLNTGKVVGEQTLPVASTFATNKPDAMSFSPDGLELALVVPSGTWDKALAIYSVADGKLLSTAELNIKNISHSTERVAGNRLEWFPDRSKLLWRGHYVLDAKIGGPVWSAPEEDGSSDAPRKLLDGKQIVVVAGGRQNPNLITAPVPVGEIDAAAATVANGGDAVEAGMPSLLKADFSKVAPLAGTATAPWTMKPDPAPAGPVFKTSIALPAQRPGLGGVFISRPDVGRAVVWYSNNSQARLARGMSQLKTVDPPAGRDTVIMDVIDLTTGKIKPPIAIGYPSGVLDVSPDGDFAAIKSTKRNDDRIDIYSIRDDKQIAGWRPYLQKEDRSNDIESAVLIDHEYCLTVNNSNVAYMWKLPECQAVWRMEGGTNWCLTPGGKYLGFQSGTRYAFLDPKTGEMVGDVQTHLHGLRCAFHPVGTHFALLGTDSVCRKLAVVDVATGKLTADFFIPHGAERIQWCGDTHLLVDGKWLIDLQQKKIAWTYELPYGFPAATQPDGKYWYVVGSGPFEQTVFLSSATIPDKTTLATIGAAQLPDEALLQPGMQINLQVNLSAIPPMHPNLATEVTNSYKAAMEKAGFVVGAGSPYTFVITSVQNNPGGNMELTTQRRGGEKITVAITAVDYAVNLMANGQSIWKHDRSVSNRLFVFALLRDGEDATTHLSNQMWNGLASALKKMPVPSQIFSPNAGAGLGKSVFVPGGAQPATN